MWSRAVTAASPQPISPSHKKIDSGRITFALSLPLRDCQATAFAVWLSVVLLIRKNSLLESGTHPSTEVGESRGCDGGFAPPVPSKESRIC